MFQQKSTYQTYNGNKYLDHQINAEGLEPDFRLFGDRVPSYGIINFGYFKGGQKKSFKPIDNDISVDILLRSIWAFTTNAITDEVTIEMFLANTEVLEQRLSNNEMPYTFPPGAIWNPNLTLEVQPKYDTSQLVIYWQPVHVLSYLQV